jgi:GntR family transcriptional regulator
MISPVYVKIFDDIKLKINSAELKPGDAIDSETTLCKEYGTSRMTVRNGLAMLVNEGYIYSIPGKGNFVKKPEHNKYNLYYDEMNNAINSVDKTKLLEVNIILPDEKLADSLQITKNKRVIMLRRLFYTEGKPIAYDVKYLIYNKGTPIVEKEIEYASFPEMLSKSVSLFTLKKDLLISAQIPDQDIKRYLEIREDLALLVVEQKLYNLENKPMGLGTTFYRGDYIKLEGTGQ